MTDQERNKAAQLQQECHVLINEIFPRLKTGSDAQRYDAAKDVWIYNTLAGILVRLEKLEQKQ